MSPRQRIASVGYAIRAENVDSLPKGIIVMWSGRIVDVPSGWALCDGRNGTPDLRNRFIVGAGSDYVVGITGGEAMHTLSIAEMPSHNHANGDYKYLLRIHPNSEWTTPGIDSSAGEPDIVTKGEIQSVGSGQPHENRPPYYALAYIMKL